MTLIPQLVWRGKSDDQLEVVAPPLYIQERVHPKALIDDLARVSKRGEQDAGGRGSGSGFADIFADFNGLPSRPKLAQSSISTTPTGLTG